MHSQADGSYWDLATKQFRCYNLKKMGEGFVRVGHCKICETVLEVHECRFATSELP